ncbi:MAG: peptide chain release factor-like protein [Planctomycetota bacterium]
MGPNNPGVRVAPGVFVPEAALRFRYDASSGPGGQHANKVSTRAHLAVRLTDIPVSHPTRARLARLGRRWLTPPDASPEDPLAELRFVSGSQRSQRQNAHECLERLRELVLRAVNPPKPRRPTKPSRGSIERRLKAKKEQSDRKRLRRKPGQD